MAAAEPPRRPGARLGAGHRCRQFLFVGPDRDDHDQRAALAAHTAGRTAASRGEPAAIITSAACFSAVGFFAAAPSGSSAGASSAATATNASTGCGR